LFHFILKETFNLKITEDDIRSEDIYWDMIFNTKRNLTEAQRETCKFTHCIQTDGVSACVHYRRPLLHGPQYDEYTPSFEQDPTDRIIGQDPGRSILFSGAECIGPNKWKKHVLSKKCYYEESGINKLNRDSERWNKSLKVILDALSLTNTRSSRENFIEYIGIIKTNFDVMWNEYSKKRWARNRLRVYSGKQSVFDKFFNKLKDNSGRRVVIAYGDAGFKSSSKNERSAPTTRLLRETKKHFDVVMINEYNTTRICHGSGIKLADVVGVTVRGIKRKVRGFFDR
jgi:hypothetical protein